AELRAAIRADLSWSAVERLLRCIEIEESSTTHRMDASLALLKASETLGSESLRDRVVATISAEDLASATALKRLEFRLLVAVTSRDWDLGAEIAAEMLRECEAQGEDTLAGYAYNASAALLYGGRLEAALDGFLSSHAMATRMGSAQNQLAAALVLQ